MVLASFVHGATLDRVNPGQLRFVVLTDPSWDQFTAQPSPAMKAWFNKNVTRMMVYSSYWDQRLAWYPNAWAYINLYAIYTNSDVASKHPEWVLKDRDGKGLYIPWGCHDGTCPQYAANLADPGFRKHWLDAAKHLKSIGYKGLFIDDVNQEFRVSDRNSKQMAPFDRKSKRELSWDDWRRSLAEFTEEIRKTFPDLEIVHNAIWYAGGAKRDADPYVKRQLASANYINLERGVNDSGLRGGNGEWSLRALFAYIDRVHELGTGVMLDHMGGDIEYTAASFLLISSGIDMIGDQALKPRDWWPGSSVDLGNALGPREDWQGLIRRRFQKGVALVNPPDSPPVHLRITGSMQRADGSKAESALTLPPARGIILVGPADSVRIQP